MALLKKLLTRRWRLASASMLSSGLAAAVTLAWNAQLGGIINTVSAGQALSVRVLTLAIITMIFTAAATYAKSMISGFACESMAHDLRMGYARYFAALPVMDVEALNAGEQLSRLQNEIADVSPYLNANLFQLADDAILFVVTLVWLLFLSPVLTVSSNLPVIVILIYIAWSSKTISVATRRSQQTKMQMNGFADTLLNLFPVIRLYNAAQLTLNGYSAALKAWEVETVKLERTKALLMSPTGVMSAMPRLLLFLVGGFMVIRGEVPVGTVYISLTLSVNVSGVLMNMPSFIAAFRQFTANMERLSTCNEGG